MNSSNGVHGGNSRAEPVLMEDRDVERGWQAGGECAVLVKSPCGRCPLGKHTAAAQGKNGAQGRSSRVWRAIGAIGLSKVAEAGCRVRTRAQVRAGEH